MELSRLWNNLTGLPLLPLLELLELFEESLLLGLNLGHRLEQKLRDGFILLLGSSIAGWEC